MSITPFDYDGSPIRVVNNNGNPEWIAGDVCDHFGVTNRNRVLRQLDDDEKGGTQIDTPGGKQTVTTLTEGGLYRLLFILQPTKARGVTQEQIDQRVEQLRQFRRWVTHEVLPSIRKRGGYLTPEAAEQALTDPDFIIRLATELKTERAQRAQLEAQVEADKPKVVFADAVAASHTTILIGDLAKLLKQNGVEIGAQRLFAHLRRDGYLINRKGADWNSPTQYAMDLGLFTVKETAITHSDGHVSISKTTKVTGRGQRYFVERFLDGRLPKPFAEEVAA